MHQQIRYLHARALMAPLQLAVRRMAQWSVCESEGDHTNYLAQPSSAHYPGGFFYPPIDGPAQRGDHNEASPIPAIHTALMFTPRYLVSPVTRLTYIAEALTVRAALPQSPRLITGGFMFLGVSTRSRGGAPAAPAAYRHQRRWVASCPVSPLSRQEEELCPCLRHSLRSQKH
jgi:hypothetical protein